jgi:molybdate transport system permease protein
MSSRPAPSSAADGFDLLVGRESAELLLGEGDPPVDDNLEYTGAAFDQRDVDTVLLDQLIPRTEGPRQVVSPYAVFDLDLHRVHRIAKPDAVNYHDPGAQPCAFAGGIGGERRRVNMFGLGAEELTAVRLSLRVALWATLGSLLPALMTALLLARGRFWGKSLVDGIVHLPLVMPPVVSGYLLLLLFGRQGPLGRFFADTIGLVFAFRWTGAALASAVMGFPLMVRAIRLSLEAVDRRLEEAAGTLGASGFFVFLLITLPLIAPGIAAGLVLCYARSLGEFGATITFVSNIPGETQTLPLMIYNLTQVPGGDAAALRLTGIAIVLSMAALIASEALSRRLGRHIAGE